MVRQELKVDALVRNPGFGVCGIQGCFARQHLLGQLLDDGLHEYSTSSAAPVSKKALEASSKHPSQDPPALISSPIAGRLPDLIQTDAQGRFSSLGATPNNSKRDHHNTHIKL